MVNSDEQANRTNSVAAAINELAPPPRNRAQCCASVDQAMMRGTWLKTANSGRAQYQSDDQLSEMISASSNNIEALNSKT